MEAAQALIPEVLGNLVYPVESTDDQTFQVQLVRDTHIQRHVERVVMRLERSGRGATIDRLKNRRFDLQESPLIQKLSERRDEPRPAPEHLADLRVQDQVYIALPVAEFLVSDLIVYLLVRLFDDGKWAQRLRKELHAARMHRDLSHPSPKNVTLDTNDVSNVQQLLEDIVVEAFL